MKFGELLEIVRDEPVFDTGLLLAGDRDPTDVRRQLSRWVRSGRLVQLRRGLYSLGERYRGVTPHPFLVANRLVRGSYVSLESALAHHGMIPEYVASTTSVCTGRPRRWETPLGGFEFRHLRRRLLRGFERVALSDGQEAYVATPEKALLDLVYLIPGADAPAYLDELRLQNLDRLQLDRLMGLAGAFGKPKLQRAVAGIARRAEIEALEYEAL